MAKLFISHRGADADLAERLAMELRNAGHEIWLDTWKLGLGDEIAEEMSRGLADADYVIVCYSSLGLAPWMSAEVWSSLARQLQGEGVRLLPVLLSGGSPPALLRGRKYADLVSNWSRGVKELLAAIG